MADTVNGALRQAQVDAYHLPLGAPGSGTATIDWTGFPTRVAHCVSRREALDLLDWHPTDGSGGRALQEEYVEWRVVREGATIRRVELTTELSAYWTVLAAYEPAATLELVAEFAREREVDRAALYGTCDAFGHGVTAAERKRAFIKTVVEATVPSPYNSGERAICFMTQPSNGLRALVWLLVVGAARLVTRDSSGSHLRCLTCAEAIPLLREAAVLGRASDPLVVERLGRLAFEGRKIGLAEPVGVYIQGVEATRLRTPSGDAVPAEWFSFSRGVSASEAADGRARFQRLTLEVPREHGFAVSDLVDVATERPISRGGEIADLVQVAIVISASERGAVRSPAGDPLVIERVAQVSCEDVRSTQVEYRSAGATEYLIS